MELDKAFQFAVTLAWEDLMKATQPGTVRVEYQCEPGTCLDYLSVWSVRAWGYYHLVCDYWTWTSPDHPSGTGFRKGHSSGQLAETLDFIMKNQDQFTRPADACRDGLVLIGPPTGDERREAATWMKSIPGTTTDYDILERVGLGGPERYFTNEGRSR